MDKVLFVILAIVFIPWREIGGWVTDTVEAIWDWFGWGIIFIVCAILTPIFLVLRGRLWLLFRYWYRWLGIIAATFAVWGILAFYDIGGAVGMSVIVEQDGWGGFRIALLLILGMTLFVSPVIVAWLKRKKDAVVSTMKSAGTQQQEEVLKPEEVVFHTRRKEAPALPKEQHEEAANLKEGVSGRKARIQADAQPESRLKMKCRNCGNELVGAPAFCVYCGVKVPVEHKYCPVCGAATYQSAIFCTKCGTRLPEQGGEAK